MLAAQDAFNRIRFLRAHMQLQLTGSIDDSCFATSTELSEEMSPVKWKYQRNWENSTSFRMRKLPSRGKCNVNFSVLGGN